MHVDAHSSTRTQPISSEMLLTTNLCFFFLLSIAVFAVPVFVRSLVERFRCAVLYSRVLQLLCANKIDF